MRKKVVLDLCERLIAQGHPDVRALPRAELQLRAQHLPEDGMPEFVAHLLKGEGHRVANLGLHPDKNATPSEPPQEPARVFANLRPSALLFERHSDTLKDALAAQTGALSMNAILTIQAGKSFEYQLKPNYISRSFSVHFSLPPGWP